MKPSNDNEGDDNEIDVALMLDEAINRALVVLANAPLTGDQKLDVILLMCRQYMELQKADEEEDHD